MQNINAVELLPALVSPFSLGSLLDNQALLSESTVFLSVMNVETGSTLRPINSLS